MKRPIFLKIWLVLMLILSVSIAIDSLTYLPFIFFTKSYLSLIGIVAGFLQVWAIIQLLKWKKIGVKLLIISAIAIFLVTAIDQPNVTTNISQAIASLLIVLIVNIVIYGILYFAIKPVWKNFK